METYEILVRLLQSLNQCSIQSVVTGCRPLSDEVEATLTNNIYLGKSENWDTTVIRSYDGSIFVGGWDGIIEKLDKDLKRISKVDLGGEINCGIAVNQ